MAKKKVVHYINQFYAGVGGDMKDQKGLVYFSDNVSGMIMRLLRRLFVEIIRLQNIQKKLFRRL